MALFTLLLSTAAQAGPISTSAGEMTITPILRGLDEPWGVAVLPGDTPAILVTERAGRLILAQDGQTTVITGTPQVYDEGQGGLLDVMVPRDFATTREIWLTFARAEGDGAATAVGKGTLSAVLPLCR